MARTPKSDDAPQKRKFSDRIRTVRTVFTLGRELDPKLPLWLAGVGLGVIAVFVLIGFLLGHPIIFGIFGVFVGVLSAMIVFGRRITRAQINQIHGQPGASAAVVQSMRGDWRVYTAVAVTRDQDMVHRVIARPGIILLAEGNPNRLRNLLGQEKKRLGKVVGDTPIYDVVVGDGEGQVPLANLQKYLLKLPRNITPKLVNEYDRRLQALPGTQLPMPKGPLPRNIRMPKGANPRMR
jgi:Domain of unknown function (DUF4191)